MALVLDTNSFITIADANTYFNDNLRNDSWKALSGSTKQQALITAAGQINLLLKSDCKFGSGDISVGLANANAELALDMAIDPNLVTSGGTSKNTKRVKAGSAEVQFFRPTKGKRFPSNVMNLLIFLDRGWVLHLLCLWWLG